jgi:hypothetical protein
MNTPNYVKKFFCNPDFFTFARSVELERDILIAISGYWSSKLREILMTHKSVKLLALAIIYGCSMIGFGLVPSSDGRILVMFLSLAVTGPWFLLYWFLSDNVRR